MIARPEGYAMVLLTPETKREAAWLKKNVDAEPWQWFGSSLAVDHRCAAQILEGAIAEGF